MEYPQMMAKQTQTPMVFERDKVISLRLTAEEQEEIREAAQHMGLRPAAFLRVAGLEKARSVKREK